MRHLRLAFFIASLLSAICLRASAVFPQIELLRPELEKYAASLKGEQRSAYGRDIGPVLQSLLAQISADLTQENYDSADQQLRQLRQMAPSPAVISRIDEITMVVREARSKREAVLAAKADELAARTAELCLKATNIKEFDSLLVQLAETRTGLGRNYNSEALQHIVQKIESATQHARRWQDYLEQKHAGNERGAIQIMTELANNSHLFPILPRSELLARTRSEAAPSSPPAQTSKLASITVEINSLADLPGAIEKLKAATVGGNSNNEVSQLLVQLRNMLSGVRALERGELGTALQHATGGFFGSPDHEDLLTGPKQELIMRILPQLVIVPENLTPQTGESPSVYLLRVLQQARTDKDWLLALRTLDAMSRVTYANTNPPEWIQQDRTALGFYVGGLNQEKAGDATAALNSFRAALKTPSRTMPVDDVAARVKELARKLQEGVQKQTHPR